MSRGLGRTQRAILSIIAAAKPDDTWTFEELATLVYGGPEPTRTQLSSVGRALKRMRLPGSWAVARVFGRPGQWVLYNRAGQAFEVVELIDIEALAIELGD
jgi:hypothetical protein